MTLTEKQKVALTSLASGPAPMAIKHFGALRAAGYVEKAEGLTVTRGYSGAQITAAGRAALVG